MPVCKPDSDYLFQFSFQGNRLIGTSVGHCESAVRAIQRAMESWEPGKSPSQGWQDKEK